MRRLVIILFFTMVGVSFLSCTKKNKEDIPLSVVENKAVIKFENDVLDFHTINDGEKVTGSFKFKNTGKHDLVISDVSANCGCTVADYPHNEIKSGQEGTISVTYDSKGSKGMRVQKQITVLSNTDPPRHILKIVADVR